MLDRRETLTALIDGLSSYFLDNCPSGMNWEDFDPDLDEARSLLQNLYETPNLLRSGLGGK